MSRDIQGKLAKGQKLDEIDVRYAMDRGIQLPEEYGVQVSEMRRIEFGTPVDGPIAATGAAFEMPDQPSAMGPGVFLSADALGILSNPALDAIAEALDVEVPKRKAGKVAALVGASPVSDEDGEDEDDD
jgi:hypothetical protein